MDTWTSWDDETRTVHGTDENNVPITRPYNDSENENVDRAIADAARADAETVLDAARVIAAAEISPKVKNALEALQRLNAPKDGSPWRPPAEATTAYWVGAKVTWKGQTWVNRIVGNPHEPGVAGWDIVPKEGQIEPWVQPDGSGGYGKGKIVSYNGRKWESTFAGKNVWIPGTVGEDIWKDLGPLP